MAAVMITSTLPTAVFAVDETEEPAGIMALAAGGTVENFVGSDGEHDGEGYGWMTEGQLHAQDGSQDKNLGKGWNDIPAINNPFDIDINDEDAAFRVWKLQIDGGIPTTAHFWFYVNNDYDEYDFTEFTISGNGAVCLIVMPDGYRLVGGYALNCDGIKANYAGKHSPETVGTVTVTADVTAWHNEITPHEYYERTVDKYLERTADEYYERTVDKYSERTVDEYYTRTADEYYVRPVTEIMQRYAQRYLIPVFEKKLEGAYNDTLVTRLEYDGDTAKAKPINGGAFKNGHTYVAVNVNEASQEGGVNFTIADSSKNNGKKAPDQYNRPIDYTYNVKIKDGKLTVSFPEDLAYASVGAYVYATAPKDAKNTPKHYDGSVTVDLPKNCGDTVYLYTHIEKLGWYDLDEAGKPIYVFKEWRYDDSRTEYDKEYTKIDTVYGKYALDHTDYGDYKLENTVYGEYGLEDTVYGDYKLEDTVYGEYVKVNTVYGDYVLEDTVYGNYVLEDTVYGDYVLENTETIPERIDDDYEGTLTLVVTNNADGNVVTGVSLDEPAQLEAGTYTFTLSGEGFGIKTQTVTINADESTTVSFTVAIQGADVTVATEKHYADKDADEHFADKDATKHYANKEAEKHYADKTAEEHFADKEAIKYYANKEAEKHYSDAEATQQYNEKYLYKEDIKLGNETDADGEYAVKDN